LQSRLTLKSADKVFVFQYFSLFWEPRDWQTRAGLHSEHSHIIGRQMSLVSS